MYVSNKRKIVFVHIPKTGGTAMIRALGLGLEGPKHGKPNRVSGGFFVFTLVRDPYRRLVSYYRFQIRKRPERCLTERYATFLSFITLTAGKYIIRQSDLIDNSMHVYHQERLEEALEDVCRRAGIPKTMSLIRDDRTLYYGDYDYRQYMTPEAVEFINDYCDQDFRWYPKRTFEQIMEGPA